MEFTIEKNIFENAISTLQPFLEKKDQSAITSHIYLEITNNNLLLKATDYEIGLEINIPKITHSIEGKATVNGSNLLGIIKRLKSSEIIIKSQNDNLIIKQNKSNFKLPSYDEKEYPNLYDIQDLKVLDINSMNLINSIKKITPAIDNNNPKFELNGALIDIQKDKINFVATDTRRLAVSNLQNISNEENQIIIPKKAIIEIQKLFLDKASIKYNHTNLIISTNTMKFFTKLINGKFPDYKRIIPNQIKYNLNLKKDLLIESTKLVTSLFSNIKITFKPNMILFESLDENSEAQTQIDVHLNIDIDFYIAVNAKYLLDFLSLTNNENVKIGFNESNMPFYLEDNNFFTIVMPIILEK